MPLQAIVYTGKRATQINKGIDFQSFNIDDERAHTVVYR